MKGKAEVQHISVPDGSFSCTRRPASIHDLPDDILVRIFSTMPCYDSMSKVCRRWGAVTHEREPDIWKARLEIAGLLPVDENTVLGRCNKSCFEQAMHLKEAHEYVQQAIPTVLCTVREFLDGLKLRTDVPQEMADNLSLRAESLLKKSERIRELMVNCYRQFYEAHERQLCVKKDCQPFWTREWCSLCTHMSKLRWVEESSLTEICGEFLAVQIFNNARFVLLDKIPVFRLDDILRFIAAKESSDSAKDIERQLVSSNDILK